MSKYKNTLITRINDGQEAVIVMAMEKYKVKRSDAIRMAIDALARYMLDMDYSD